MHTGIEESAKHFDAAYERNDAYFNNDAKEIVCGLYLDYLDGIVEHRGRLLDLGAGFGSFVNAARERGWDAIGVEPSATGARRAKNQFPKIEIIHGALGDVPADLTFDVITMWDVVEHLDDPMDLLRQAGGRLRTGGLLVVETGNYESAERSQGGLDWWGYLSDHRWFLNPRALSRMLRGSGFSDVSVAPRCMRPQAKMPPWIPSKTNLAARIARRPWRAGYFLRLFVETEKMRAAAPETYELSIFTAAARKTAEARPTQAGRAATAG